MQFRESSDRRRVQCLAPEYDRDSKRTRQKLVFTIDFHSSKVAPGPGDLRSGSPEQREQWSKEIAAYLADRADVERKDRIKGSIIVAERAMSRVVEDLKSKTPLLTEADEERVGQLIKGWAKALEISLPVLAPAISTSRSIPSARRTSAGEGDPRAFSPDLIDRAKKLREEGLSIAAVAERLTSEGDRVSKSWVQKVTR